MGRSVSIIYLLNRLLCLDISSFRYSKQKQKTKEEEQDEEKEEEEEVKDVVFGR